MASPAISPPPSPGAPPVGAPGPAPQGASGILSSFQSLPPMQKLAFLSMASDKMASEIPETAPMMREVQKQAQTATMKLIQQRQAQQTQAPQI